MRIRNAIVCALFCTLYVLSVPNGWTQQTLDFSNLEKVVREELQQTNTPGVAVAIVLGDRVIYEKGFGVANVETEAPVTPDMLFRLGSTTKMFTATALVLLADQGKINLNDPIGKYISGQTPRLSQITAHQVLSHTSGILDEAPMFGSNDESALGGGIRSWKDDRFFTDPGKIYSYSNPGYWLAGFLSETVGGRLYADQVSETIFKPLGMTRTTLRPLVAITYPLAQGHDVSNGRPSVVRPAANNTATWPAGSMFSSARDLSRFVIAFVNDGRIDSKQVLPSSVIAKLQTPNVSIPGSDSKYAYGLNIGTMQGLRVVQHGGSRSGYGSTIRMVPDRRFGVIILGNRTGTSLNRTADKAMEIALSLSPPTVEAPRASVEMTDSEMMTYIGTYSQGLRTMEIIKRDGRLYVKQGSQENVLSKVGAQELSYPVGRIVFVAGESGRIEYIHIGGRSWKKMPIR